MRKNGIIDEHLEFVNPGDLETRHDDANPYGAFKSRGVRKKTGRK